MLSSKSLKQVSEEVNDIITRLEINSNKGNLTLRNSLADYSICSNNVILKKGIYIKDRFFIITVATEENYLIFDAYEEKTEKRLELKIKR